MKASGLSVLAVLFCAASVRAGDLVLVEKGANPIPIIVAQDASAATRQAAGELAGYIEKISGARPAVLAGAPNPAPARAVWVGIQPGADTLFPKSALDFQHPEEITFFCNGAHLLIAGRDRMAGGTQTEYGTANAVYAFLEKRLGVRWFWPGPLGEDVLRQETVTLPPLEYRFHPPLRMRFFHRGSRGWQADPLIADWFRFQRMELDSARFSAGHSFTDWWEKYHPAHPDWFALREDGTRTPEKWGANPYPQAVKLCVSNPAVAEQWLKNAAEELAKNPATTMLGATPNDGGGFCTCPNCRAWDNPNGPPVWGYVALTDRYVKFWNILARGLKERFPNREVCLGVYAYSAYRTPPVAEKLEKNVILAYVGCFPFETEANRREQKDDWKRWSESVSMMWYRPNLWYWCGGIWGFPEITLTKMAEDFRFLAEHHCVGLEVDGYRGYWATQGPAYYLMAHLAYEPFLDAGELMKDYYRRGFGPAAEELGAYWSMMEDARDRMVQLPGFKTGSGTRYELPPLFEKIYTEDFLKRADDLLTRGVAKTAGGPGTYRQRVQYVRDGFEYTRLLMRTIPLMKRARESGGKDVEAVRQADENWKAIQALVERAGVIAISWYAYVTNWMNGEGYMGGMQDYFGPPSEAMKKAAYSGPKPVDAGQGRE